MKTILSFIVLFISINTFSQTRKLEVTDNQSGKSIFFQEAQRVKVTTTKREQLVGTLTFENPESITINGMPIPINNINSIKYFPKKGAVLKNIILGTGLGLVAGSGIAAAFGNGNAFSLFAAGAGTTIAGGLIGGNKTYIKQRSTFKIIE
ncbi:hypothetical protein [Flavobacterium psychrophilum]|jgi:signal transduction histidine kinase|uniref:hypothetical protein n=1 Tax=Flavobacterium psychrophilum TaxID=96345 RepID=UPI000B7C168C|nr:hypothetical protein [Flavobacterium psychrophilum]EKT3958566.1 hypothetical protein [Flavobacterium psychrophilum]EKT4510864.1 hypothetical protein [Flavobacterium psychrophilum]EKT4551511.1 hypothetical protein [Flavobacterium psychrophilum]MBF2024153.1 hypothetical protein [Flavobacterium psychrophilum]MCB5982942.1 hypothetical protein [Flavobacterium psychrophilum]